MAQSMAARTHSQANMHSSKSGNLNGAFQRPGARRPRLSGGTAAAPLPWHGFEQLQQCRRQQQKSVVAYGSSTLSSWHAVESGDETEAEPYSHADTFDAVSKRLQHIVHLADYQEPALPPIRGSTPPALVSMPHPEVGDSTIDAAAAARARSWHLSYDEEAEEGCGEEDCIAHPFEADKIKAAAAALSAVQAVPAPSCSIAFLYPSDQQQQQQQAVAAPGAIGSLAYFVAKPWDQSYDEEAEGCYEAAAAEAAAAHAVRLATFLERRAQSRAAAKARRAGVRTRLGDLEAMQPWVDDSAVATAAAAVKNAAGRVPPSRYPHLQAFLAAQTAMGALDSMIDALQRERGLQARRNQTWQYTWDEEAHGGVLSSM